MATKEDIKEKLNILGLDLENLPAFLTETKPIIFNPSRLNNDKELKVYKYVPIKDIEIYCTTAHRDDPIKEKYSKSMPLGRFIEESEHDSEKSAELLNLFERISDVSIKRVALEQSKMADKIPFTVHYPKNQLWQIYYSADTDRYFMLVSVKEDTFDELYYLLKKKIEIEKNNKDERIFVPISYVNYSEKFLSNKEINDIENYLWVFTKNWSLTYEVYDLDDKLTIQIVGETPIYDSLKTMYKIILHSKEEAEEFYKLTKALFILQTELGNRYSFTTQINENNGIEFFYEGKKISYGDLPEFIKEKYIETEGEIKKFNQKSFKLENKLKELKAELKKEDAEYFIKQKEISTYLECKKTFFGKVKYFFSKKKNKPKEEIEVVEEKEETKEPKPIQGYTDDKKYHTIDDLVTVQALYEKSERYVKDLTQDIKAMELRIVNTKKKIENATLYIQEIDQHKKSLFDFWKFANKDELLELDTGDEIYEGDAQKIKKKFDYEYDFEDFGIAYDKLERTKFSKQELDSIYVASTNVLPIINMLKNGDMDKDALEEQLRSLKSEYFTSSNSTLGSKIDFDIFGSMKDDPTQVKYLNNKSHRENEKDKFQILNINKKIDIFDFTEKLQLITSSLNEAMHKIKFDYDMPIYKVASINEKLHKTDFNVLNINAEREIESYDNKFETAVKLFKLNFKEGYPAVFLTNATYYDNANNTLPNGMDVTSKVIIDADMFEYELVKKEKMKTNRYFNIPETLYPRILTIYIEEYDVYLKGQKPEKNEEEIYEEIPEIEENEAKTEKNEKVKGKIDNVDEVEENEAVQENETKNDEKVTVDEKEETESESIEDKTETEVEEGNEDIEEQDVENEEDSDKDEAEAEEDITANEENTEKSEDENDAETEEEKESIENEVSEPKKEEKKKESKKVTKNTKKKTKKRTKITVKAKTSTRK